MKFPVKIAMASLMILSASELYASDPHPYPPSIFPRPVSGPDVSFDPESVHQIPLVWADEDKEVEGPKFLKDFKCVVGGVFVQPCLEDNIPTLAWFDLSLCSNRLPATLLKDQAPSLLESASEGRLSNKECQVLAANVRECLRDFSGDGAACQALAEEYAVEQ